MNIKTNKKWLWFLGMCLTCIFILAGCTKNMTADQIMQKVWTAYDQKKSMILKTTIGIQYDDADGQDMSIKLEEEIEIIREPSASHTTVTCQMTIAEEVYDYGTESYIVLEDGQTNGYVYMGNQWSHTGSSVDATQDHESILLKMSQADAKVTLDDQTQSVNGAETYVLHGEVPIETVQEFIDIGSVLWSMLTEAQGNVSTNAAITLYVDKSTFLPVQIQIDLLTYGQAFLTDVGLVGEGLTLYKSIIVFNSFDDVAAIIVPENVKEAVTNPENSTGDSVDNSNSTNTSQQRGEDGSYILSSEDNAATAAILVPDGFSFIGSSSLSMTIVRNEEEFVTYGYASSLEADSMDTYYRAALSYLEEETDTYHDVVFDDTAQINVNDQTFQYIRVTYMDEDVNEACIDFYVWTIDDGCVFICEILGRSRLDESVLQTALEAVTFQ